MYIPESILVTVGLIGFLYLVARIRDKRQDRKNEGELKWLRLRVEYLENPEKFEERTKDAILANHRLMRKIYSRNSKEEIVEDLKETTFRTSKAFAKIFSENYVEEE